MLIKVALWKWNASEINWVTRQKKEIFKYFQWIFKCLVRTCNCFETRKFFNVFNGYLSAWLGGVIALKLVLSCSTKIFQIRFAPQYNFSNLTAPPLLTFTLNSAHQLQRRTATCPEIFSWLFYLVTGQQLVLRFFRKI